MPRGKVANRKGNGTPAISGNSKLVKYYSIWPAKIEHFAQQNLELLDVFFSKIGVFFFPSLKAVKNVPPQKTNMEPQK